jgi:hypothetical protein
MTGLLKALSTKFHENPFNENRVVSCDYKDRYKDVCY